MNYYIEVIKKYAVFSGRARRAEYWYFVLFNTIIYTAVTIISNAIGDKTNALISLYILFMFVPSLAVTVRRLHDVDYSGWFLLVTLIPLIGIIWIFVLTLFDSNPDNNKYGANPKTAEKTTNTA